MMRFKVNGATACFKARRAPAFNCSHQFMRFFAGVRLVEGPLLITPSRQFSFSKFTGLCDRGLIPEKRKSHLRQRLIRLFRYVRKP
jgi:hypothetical protein